MAEPRTFATSTEAFEYACEQVDCSLKDGRAVLAVVLAVRGRVCAVKVANPEDKSIPEGTLPELLARTDLNHVCFSAMLDPKVPDVEPGDLVMYTTMPELAAIGKTTTAGSIVARVVPHYTPKGGWQVWRPPAENAAEQNAESPEAPRPDSSAS
jgi:hypothetical protein